MKTIIIFLCLIVCITACNTKEKEISNAIKSITTDYLAGHVSKLGSDAFMGRQPFTEGETITVNYLAEELKSLGFEPAFSGSYLQDVYMTGISSSIKELTVTSSDNKVFKLNTPDEAAIISPQVKDEIRIDGSDLIFAGFGIVAPEYGWNDYESLDVRGKTVVVMINDPGLYTGDTALFKGREMTYYGRWTYKYEEAARQGAMGVIIIHETEGAGYSYTIPRKSSITSRLYLESADSNASMCQFTGWFSDDAAATLFSERGYDVEKLRKEACSIGFRGFALNMKISLKIRNTIRFNKSFNVAGILRGTVNPHEAVVYTAHWDHFGIGEKEKGDSIYNGAVDNGTSMAWELAVGRAFASLRKKPERSIILLFPTAEEQGLLGSAYYTNNPVTPLNNIVTCINNDVLLPIGRMKDVTITGYGQTDLDSIVRIVAERQDRYLTGDPDSHTGMYFRSDQFSFVQKGIPSLYCKGSVDSREYGKEWAAMQNRDYLDNRYHRPADNYDPESFNFDGIAEDAALAFMIGYDIANSDYFPRWRKGSEFNMSGER